MYNIIFLLPHHENKESLEDTISNLFKFNSNICVYINNGSNENLDDLNSDRVCIIDRKVQYKKFDTMIPLHIELYDQIKKDNVHSEYVCLLATNQLFVKSNLYELMRNYDASFFEREIDSGCISSLCNNQIFRIYYDKLNNNFKYQSNPDGMFFKYSIFTEMIEYFDKFRDTQVEYHADEFLYVAYLLFKNYSLLEFKNYNYWQVDWRVNLNPVDLNEIKSIVKNDKFYIVKRIARNINDEARKYVKNL